MLHDLLLRLCQEKKVEEPEGPATQEPPPHSHSQYGEVGSLDEAIRKTDNAPSLVISH